MEASEKETYVVKDRDLVGSTNIMAFWATSAKEVYYYFKGGIPVDSGKSRATRRSVYADGGRRENGGRTRAEGVRARMQGRTGNTTRTYGRGTRPVVRGREVRSE